MIEKKVKDTIEKYKLISKKDKVVVAASGGKDSSVVLYLLKNLGYNVSALFIDLGIGNYSKKNRENIIKFCEKEKIKLNIVSFKEEFGYSLCYIRDILKEKDRNMKACTVCGILRRYLLNKKAREMKADKIVTGHNLDDEAQAILMNLFKANTNVSARLGPMVGVVKDKKLIPRIKPLYFVSEEEVKEFSMKKKFPVLYDKCPCVVEAYRNHVRNLLNEYEKKNKGTKENIVLSFLDILPSLRKKYSGELNYCKKCGEPSSGDVCNKCLLMKRLTL